MSDDILSKDFPLISNLSMTSEQLFKTPSVSMLEGFRQSDSLASNQWLRAWSLIVYQSVSPNTYGGKTAGLDLSLLRVNFNVKKMTSSTPNLLYARIYNLSPATENQIKQFGRVQLSAGYRENCGQIFDGTVVQYVQGKENAVDTYLDIWAGEGDAEFNNATMNRTFPAGSSLKEHVNAMVGTLTDIKPGEIRPEGGEQRSVRATTYVGMTRDKLRDVANATNSWYFIDGNQFYMFPMSGYRLGEEVVLTPKTGLIGMPEVQPDGIHAKCLLNPKLRLGGVIQIRDNNGRSGLSNVPFIPGSTVPWSGSQSFGPTGPNKIFSAAATSPTGRYIILLMDHHGDSRGTPWYTDMVCMAADVTNKWMGSALTRSLAVLRRFSNEPIDQSKIPT